MRNETVRSLQSLAEEPIVRGAAPPPIRAPMGAHRREVCPGTPGERLAGGELPFPSLPSALGSCRAARTAHELPVFVTSVLNIAKLIQTQHDT